MADPDPTAPTPATASTSTVTAKGETSATTVKAGWRTSEFYVQKGAWLLSALFATDVIPTASVWMKIALVSAFMLTSMGYTVSRTKAKS